MNNSREMVENIDELLRVVGYKYDGVVTAETGNNSWIISPRAYRSVLAPIENAEVDFIDENANKRIFITVDENHNMELFSAEVMKSANAPWYHEFPEWQIFYAKDGKRDSWFWYRTHALFVKISKNGEIKGNRVSGPVLSLCEGDTLSVEKFIETLDKLNDSRITKEALQSEVPAMMRFFKKKKMI